MDTSESFIFIAVPQLYALNLLASGSATILFLFFYIRYLLSQETEENVDRFSSLPTWWKFMYIMYPNWLDKLSYQNIIKAFAMALVLAIVDWTILAMIFLVAIMKLYGP